MPSTPRQLPGHASVVIIGGGFAGAATAYALTRQLGDGPGARPSDGPVLIVEREATCGYHASGRNAALGRQLTEHDGFTALTVAGAAFLRDPPLDFGDGPLLHPTGSILLCDRDDEIDHMAARAASLGLPHERVTPAGLYQRWPLLAAVPTAGGVSFPTDGVIDVHALLSGFLAGARAAGARVEVDCEVTGFRPTGDSVVVATTRGEVSTRVVVMAAGAWVGALARLAGSEPVHFAPIRRHLFITQAVPAPGRQSVPTIHRAAPFVWHVGACEFYVRPEGKGFLLSGCDETEVAPCDAVPAPGAIDDLAARLSPIAPRLAELGIARSWACLRTFAPDREPVIGWDERVPWLYWVAGLGGHGATASAAVGERAAVEIAARLARAMPACAV